MRTTLKIFTRAPLALVLGLLAALLAGDESKPAPSTKPAPHGIQVISDPKRPPVVNGLRHRGVEPRAIDRAFKVSDE